MRTIRFLPLLLILVAPLVMAWKPGPGAERAAAVSTIFLVRHAEKVAGGGDPALTPAGQVRTAALADLLEDAGITAVHTTDYRRTRDTVAPLADRLGVPITLYDPRDLAREAGALMQVPGRYLVSGHSDTTPVLVRLLGGEPGPPIEEAGEYDRLYILTLQPDGRVETLLLRYGRRTPPQR